MKKLTLSLAAALAAAFASQAGNPSAVLFDPDTGTLLVPTNLSVASITVSTTNLSGSAGFGNVTNLVKLPAASRTNVVLEKSDGTLTTNDLADFVKFGDGSGLTNLNASQLTSGTVPLARLPAGAINTNLNAVTNISGGSNITVTVTTAADGAKSIVIQGITTAQFLAFTTGLGIVTNGAALIVAHAITVAEYTDNAEFDGNVTVDGGIYGDGSGVINLNEDAHFRGSVTVDGGISGDGLGVINLNASQLNSGTIPPSTRYPTNTAKIGFVSWPVTNMPLFMTNTFGGRAQATMNIFSAAAALLTVSNGVTQEKHSIRFGSGETNELTLPICSTNDWWVLRAETGTAGSLTNFWHVQ